MEKKIRDIIGQHVGGTYEAKQKAAEEILLLFSVSRRYSLSYLDGQEFEHKTELWAKDKEDALKQLEKICPNATYIFVSRL